MKKLLSTVFVTLALSACTTTENSSVISPGNAIDSKSSSSPKNIIMIIGDGMNPYDAGEMWHLFDTRYDMHLTKIDNNDLKHENIVIDKSSLDMLKGSQVDFTNELIGSSFKISNPKTKSSCGCGISFSF